MNVKIMEETEKTVDNEIAEAAPVQPKTNGVAKARAKKPVPNQVKANKEPVKEVKASEEPVKKGVRIIEEAPNGLPYGGVVKPLSNCLDWRQMSYIV